MSCRSFLSENWKRVVLVDQIRSGISIKELAEKMRDPIRRSIEAQALAQIGWSGWIEIQTNKPRSV